MRKATPAVHLVPSSVGSDTSWVSTFVETYQEILGCSSPEAEAEVKTWQHKWRHQGEKPATLLSALDSTGPFDIIAKMITILSTLPVTSAEAERSLSTLRSLKTWVRTYED